MFVAPSVTHSVKNSTLSVYERQQPKQYEDSPGIQLGGYTAQYFPVRPLLRVEETDGAWLVAHKAEERRRFNELLLKQHRDSRRQGAAAAGSSGRRVSGAAGTQAEEEEHTCLDGFYLLRVVRVDDPSFVCHVDVSGRNLTEVKEEDLQLFDSVTSLKAGENLLKLEPLNGFPNLRELEIPFNGLRNLQLTADSFPNLEFLDVSYNELTKEDLFNIGLLKRLRRLHAGGNGLAELPEDLALPEIAVDGEANQRFQSLECLMLDDNRLSDPKAFASLACLRKLKVLSLEKNEFTGIPYLRVTQDDDGLSASLSPTSAATVSVQTRHRTSRSARGSRSSGRISARKLQQQKLQHPAEPVAAEPAVANDLTVVGGSKPAYQRSPERPALTKHKSPEEEKEASKEEEEEAAPPRIVETPAAVVVPSAGDADENGAPEEAADEAPKGDSQGEPQEPQMAEEPVTSDSADKVEAAGSLGDAPKPTEPELSTQKEPEPTAQKEPEPTDQKEPEPTDQKEPEPTAQKEPEPTDQKEPEPIDQKEPEPTDQKEPEPTDQKEPKPTAQKEPEPTDQKEPEPTDQKEPEQAVVAEVTADQPAAPQEPSDNTFRKPSTSTNEINRNIEQLNRHMMRLNRPASAPLVELAPFDLREIERAIGRRIVERRQAHSGPAPFPALRSLNLGGNRVAREEALTACGVWPALTDLLIHDNPLCRTRAGELPLLHRLLTHRLGIRVVRHRPEQGPKPRIEVEQRPNRRVVTRVPPVPKVNVDRLLLSITAAADQPPSMQPQGGSTGGGGVSEGQKQPDVVEAEVEAEEDKASDWGDGVFLTSVTDQAAEAGAAAAAAAAAKDDAKRGEEDEDDLEDDIDLLLTDRFGDADGDDDETLPQDVAGSVQALQYLLDHPITLDGRRPPLAEAGAAYREHRPSRRAPAPAPRPTRAELARNAVETSRRANPRVELPLPSLLRPLPPLRQRRRRVEPPPAGLAPAQVRGLLGGVERRYQTVRDRSLQQAKEQAREKIAAMVEDIRDGVHRSLRARQANDSSMESATDEQQVEQPAAAAS